eukprot:TRINITY_DN26951_c0_g1_i1.p1 TRINITY_DN26951_c0_g1~~TRINITY_DN26951_c0_g1_i1.p1  ORF type:complete len:822 (+),score=220.07 TRINITY_DN26951_c0_g1_i1:213-2468(+)
MHQKIPRITAPAIVAKLNGAGLKTLLYLSVQKDEVYCLIGAPRTRLEREAQRTHFELSLDKDKCIRFGSEIGFTLAKFTQDRDEYSNLITTSLWDNLYGRFTVASKQLYKTYYEDSVHKNSVFRAVDRIKLIVSIIEAEVKLGGAGLAIGRLMKQEDTHLQAFFALHDKDKKNHVEQVFRGWKKPFQLDIDEIRDYFGEEVGLYFKFLEFYNKALVIIAIFGVLFFIAQAVEGIGTIYKSKVCWVMGIIGALWSAFLMERWKQEESFLKVRWGTARFEEKEQPRPEFRGMWVRSPITGKLQEFFPFMEKVRRQLISRGVIFVLICCVIAAVSGIFVLRSFLVLEVNAVLGKYIAAVVNVVQIQIFNFIYSKISARLNEYENHRTETEYRDAMISKNFLFKFVNSYNSLIYLAFFQQFETNSDLQCAYIPSGDITENCLSNLRIQLVIVFALSLVMNNTTELLGPYLQSKINSCRQSWSGFRGASMSQMDAAKTVAEKQFELSTYESTTDDYEELAIQYGYVVLFIVVFPLTPLLALLNNYVEVYVDSIKLLRLTRRPRPRGAADIGAWYDVFDMIGALAIITNVALAIFGFEVIQDWTNNNIETQIWVFFAAEHVIFFLRALIQYVIPDVPYEVTQHLERQDHIGSVLIDGIEDEPENLEETMNMYKAVEITENMDPRWIYFKMDELLTTVPESIILGHQFSGDIGSLRQIEESRSQNEEEESVPLVMVAPRTKSPPGEARSHWKCPDRWN